MFLLDSNVISELRKARTGKANPGVVEWAAEVPPIAMFLSAISLHEIEYGVLLAERADPEQGAVLRAWMAHDVKPSFSDRVIPVDGDVATLAATYHVPHPAPFADATIAATAHAHGLTVVTRDTRDFSWFSDVEVLNPWT